MDTDTRRADTSHRGRHASKPSEIPARGWKDIGLRVKDQIREDNLSIVASSLAFYAMLALFPALIGFLAIYGLVVSPEQARQQVSDLAEGLPEGAGSILTDQVTSITAASPAGLGWALVASVAAALWAASSGMQQLMKAMTIVYDEDEERGFVRLRLTALGLTLGAFVFAAVALGVIAVLPPLLDAVQLGAVADAAVRWGRWVVLGALAVLALSLLYRFGPDRDQSRWRWVSWGAVIATVLWLAASLLFSIYVANFGNYNETYGSLGAVIVLLLWLYISSFVVLLGAEINGEMEHQTREDTTRGEPEPMGARDAEMADTLGETRER